MSRILAPIVLFAYKRADHIRQTLEALSKNDLANQSELIVVSDAGKHESDHAAVNEVRDLIVSKNWCGKVRLICNEKNLGLNENFFFHITNISKQYGKIIVLEEDIVTSTGFLRYMNDALDMYEHDEKVMQISGFIFNMNTKKLSPTYFLGITNGWGWATWANRWEKLNRDAADLFAKAKQMNLYNNLTLDGAEPDFWNQLESNAKGVHNHWDIKWLSSVVTNHGLCLFPKESLVVNIGFDGSGTHFKDGEKGHATVLSKSSLTLSKLPIEESLEARKALAKYFISQQPTFFDKAKFKLNLLKNKYFGK
jgi:hypothetical protein